MFGITGANMNISISDANNLLVLMFMDCYQDL